MTERRSSTFYENSFAYTLGKIKYYIVIPLKKLKNNYEFRVAKILDSGHQRFHMAFPTWKHVVPAAVARLSKLVSHKSNSIVFLILLTFYSSVINTVHCFSVYLYVTSGVILLFINVLRQ